MKLIVVRHGKAKHNLGDESKHTFAGSALDNELTKDGEENAEVLAGKINKLGGCQKIFASNLKRSVQTAKIIKNKMGTDTQIVQIPEFKEINIGDFAGRTEEEVKKMFPGAAEAFYSGDINKWDFPNGESFKDVKERVNRGLEILKKESKGLKQVVLCGHGMLNRVIFFIYNPKNIDAWEKRKYLHDRIDMIYI